YRRSYLSKLIAEVTPLAEESFPGAGVNFSYKQGWPLEKTLEEALSDNLERDRILGATQAGPHRADVTIEFEGAKAQDRVSRGQQKLLAGILWMAQNGVFQRETSRRCCFLVDDLPAELDTDRQSLFLDLLLRQDAQLVLTAISPEELPHPKLKGMGMFHVEQGEVKPVGA
ncbi:MAG: DNA replication and repair protein RecF, partial [Gammaproteobacteria bacterium]|nr:DNA replication and repair protein RecF [Gammaproteobacteria bacterium]